MIDVDKYFIERERFFLNELRKEYSNFEKNSGLTLHKKNDEFLKLKGRYYNRRVLEYWENIPDSLHGIITRENKFLNTVLTLFIKERDNYTKQPVLNFMNREYKEYREYHLKRYNLGCEKDYTFKTELFLEDREEEFLNWLAEAVVLKSFFNDNELVFPKEKATVRTHKKSNNNVKIDKIEIDKPKVLRVRNDSRTCLNQRQVSVFIKFLKKGKFILSDEFQPSAQVGLAFSALTGYSHKTLTQDISTKWEDIKREDLEKIQENLTKLKQLIDREIDKKII